MFFSRFLRRTALISGSHSSLPRPVYHLQGRFTTLHPILQEPRCRRINSIQRPDRNQIVSERETKQERQSGGAAGNGGRRERPKTAVEAFAIVMGSFAALTLLAIVEASFTTPNLASLKGLKQRKGDSNQAQLRTITKDSEIPEPQYPLRLAGMLEPSPGFIVLIVLNGEHNIDVFEMTSEDFSSLRKRASENDRPLLSTLYERRFLESA